MHRSPLLFPRHLDDPPTLLLWRIDDLVPVGLALCLGILTDQFLLFSTLGLVGVRYYSRYRDSRPDGYALHWGYWTGLIPLASRTTPNPYIRRWLP